MAKKANPTFQLAYWFVTEFLGKTWTHNIHLRHLASAKSFLNPKIDKNTGEKPKCFTSEEIKECLLDMRRNGIEGINTIRAVTWTNKKGNSYIERFTEPEPMPPIYMKTEVERWKAKQREKPCKETSKPKRVQPSTSFQPQKNL